MALSRAARALRRPQLARCLCVKPFDNGEELGFACITPNALAKSLEGSILARLLAVPGLELVGARMIQPSDDLVDDYVATMQANASESEFKPIMLKFVDYELREAHNLSRGYPNWLMFLLFRGQEAHEKVSKCVGSHDPHSAALGTTIRGAFGDYNTGPDGKIDYFQPSVVAPLTPACNAAYLRVFADHLQHDGGVMGDWWEEHDGDTDGDGIVDSHETGLVMIKPDNLERPSSLPGHIIDMISTTGLHCRGCKIFSMTPAMGREFYGFLEGIFEKKLVGLVEKKLRKQIGLRQMGFFINDDEYASMAQVLAKSNATHEVNSIMEYMTGIHPDDVQPGQEEAPGPAKCFGLLYTGEHAIERIRAKLGSTNPDEAEVGSVRSDYGKDVMRNGAHASDAPERAYEERQIVGLVGDEESEEVAMINSYLASL